MARYNEVGEKHLDKYDRNVGKAKKKIKLSKAEKKLKRTKAQTAIEYASEMMGGPASKLASNRLTRKAMLKEIARQKKKLNE